MIHRLVCIVIALSSAPAIAGATELRALYFDLETGVPVAQQIVEAFPGQEDCQARARIIIENIGNSGISADLETNSVYKPGDRLTLFVCHDPGSGGSVPTEAEILDLVEWHKTEGMKGAYITREIVSIVDGRRLELRSDGTYDFVQLEPGIHVRLVRMQPDTSFDGCELSFEITNASFGTMYNFTLDVLAYDDRGREIEPILGPGINFFEWTQNKSIAAGARSSGEKTFKVDCEFVQEIVAVDASEKYCSIRNMPEGVSCYEQVAVESGLEGVGFVRRD